jgi:hypothetical protein
MQSEPGKGMLVRLRVPYMTEESKEEQPHV